VTRTTVPWIDRRRRAPSTGRTSIGPFLLRLSTGATGFETFPLRLSTGATGFETFPLRLSTGATGVEPFPLRLSRGATGFEPFPLRPSKRATGFETFPLCPSKGATSSEPFPLRPSTGPRSSSSLPLVPSMVASIPARFPPPRRPLPRRFARFVTRTGAFASIAGRQPSRCSMSRRANQARNWVRARSSEPRPAFSNAIGARTEPPTSASTARTTVRAVSSRDGFGERFFI
jgi:hypothetical protein